MDGIVATLRANEFLNVRFLATEEEIRSAFRLLCIRYHPDKNPGQESRSGWVIKFLSEAKSDAIARCRDRKYPMLEHYKPIAIDDLSICACGFPKDSQTVVCDGCGTVYLPKDQTKENKDKVWAEVRRYARELKARIGRAIDDWELANRLFRRHFNG